VRVLVTGLNGFTGHYVGAALGARGHIPVGLESDLRDAAALSSEVARLRPDAVIHLAGLAFVGHDDPGAFYSVNLIGTRNLLAALEPLAPRHVILASSANVYGNQRAGALAEDTPHAPANDYAVSKSAMEAMAALWMDRLPISIARPFNYTGVGQAESFLIPKIVAHFRRRAEVIELGNIDVERDFGDVRDVAETYADLLDHGAIGGAVNICTGRSSGLRQVVETCAALTGHQLRIEQNPAFMRASEVRKLIGDATRLHELLGPRRPRRLEDTLAWMLSTDG
jgi:nucleoside-diphosphate-sugar epimerase